MSEMRNFWSTVVGTPGTAAASPAGVAPVPQLKKLTPEQAAVCRKYLTDHKLAALLIPLRLGINRDDYLPGLDNISTNINAIVRLLGPLTLLNPVDELRELVIERYNPLVNAAIEAVEKRLKLQVEQGTDKPGDEDGAPKKPKKDDDDGLETTVELNPKDHTLETQIQYTVRLRAKNDLAVVQVLPDVELTIHVGADGKAKPLGEVQLNLIKANIQKNVIGAGKIEIEATVSLDAQTNLGPDALKSIQTTIKGELEVKLGRFSLKPSIAYDPSKGSVEPGVAIVLWRW